MNMVNTIYNSTEDMIKKLQQLKRKTNLKIYKNISNYYNENRNKKFQTQQDPLSKNVGGISKIYHEGLLLRKFLQTEPQIKNMNIDYHDLYYTGINVRDESQDIDYQFENDDHDYINFNDFITPNLYIGIKPREALLK